MRKNTKLISLTAVLLAALMLFSACGFNPEKADLSKFLSMPESAYTGLSVSTERVKISDKDVQNYILELLASDKKELNKDVTSGTIEQFNDAELRYIAVDKDGFIVQTNMDKDDWKQDKPYNIGYEKYSGLDALIEQAVYNPATGFKASVEDHRLQFADGKGQQFDDVNTYFYVTYTVRYDGTADTVSSDGTAYKEVNTTPKLLNTPYYTQKATPGQKNIDEAIVLGIKDYYSLEYKVKLNDAGEDALYIVVHPMGTDLSDKETYKEEADLVHINYNLGEDVTKPVRISVTITGGAYLGVSSETGAVAPLQFAYTFPEDAEGTYQTASGTPDVKGAETTVYVYTVDRTTYSGIWDYNAEFMKEKADFTSSTTDEEALKKEFEAHIKQTLQDEEDAEAKKVAMELLWEKVMASTVPLYDQWSFRLNRKVKAYEKEVISQYKYLYYDYPIYGQYSAQLNQYGYKSQTTTQTDPETGEEKQVLMYPTFESFAIASYGDSSIQDMKTLKDRIYRDGRVEWTRILAAYYLADIYGIQIDETLYDAFVEKKYNEWVKAQRQYAAEQGSTLDESKLTKKLFLKDTGEDNLKGAYITDRVWERLYQENHKTVTYIDINSDISK